MTEFQIMAEWKAGGFRQDYTHFETDQVKWKADRYAWTESCNGDQRYRLVVWNADEEGPQYCDIWDLSDCDDQFSNPDYEDRLEPQEITVIDSYFRIEC